MEIDPVAQLHVLPPVTLGPAAVPAVAVTFAADRQVWRVSWLDAAGRPTASERAAAGGPWLPVTATAFPPPAAQSPDALPAGTLAGAAGPAGSVAVRSGRRVVGIPPVFPSASVVLAFLVDGHWTDVAFADEAPEAEVPSAAVALGAGVALAAYLVVSATGVECRVVELPLAARPRPSLAWRRLPPYPQEPGMAGPMVGVHRGTLLSLGGANFPDRPPWEGGVKRYYDPVFVLPPGASAWAEAGRLPVPRAYGATVSLPEGVLYAGGENAETVFQDTVIVQSEGAAVTFRAWPRLPAPITSAAAVVLDRQVFLAGGYGPGTPRISRDCFWRLNLDRPGAGWEELPAWPGPTRALAVMAAVDGAVYLLSGIEVRAKPGSGGREAEAPVYLRDAYRFRPGRGWERLPDLPWSVLAAPSPAPVSTSPPRVWVLGGVDGRQVGQLPRATPLPNDLLYFDVNRGAWRHGPEPWPTPVVCIPSFATPGGWVLATGETMAGRRTTAVRLWQPPA